MRPISNVVDVTNYVLLERNQPLHAFDLARLAGRGIVVRLADDGETHHHPRRRRARAHRAKTSLICDAERAPQAIAGIMGGSTSEVSDATTEILLESAYFERMGIARSSKRLKLRSESSARFERGIDPDAVARNAERAMELLVEVAGAQVAPDACDVYPAPVERAAHPRSARQPGERGARHRPRRRGRVGRARAARASSSTTLPSTPTATRSSPVAPTFRPDLDREIDLVEEVARRIGFDPSAAPCPTTHGQVGMLTVRQQERRAGRRRAGRARPLRGDHALAGVARRPRARRRAARPGGARHEPAARRGVGAAHRGPRRAAARGRGQPRARSGRRRALREGHVFLTARPRRRGDGPLPDEPEHVAVALAGVVRRSPVEADRARRRVRRGRCGAGGRSTRSASTTSRLSRRLARRLPRRSRRACPRRAASTPAPSVRSRPTCSRRVGPRPARWSRPSSSSTRSSPRRVVIARSARRRASRRRRSTSRSSSTTRVPADAIARDAARRGRRRARGRAPVRRVPLRRARRRPRVAGLRAAATARPTAR